MTARVVDKNTISISDKLYWLAQPVRFFVASQPIGKVAIGPTTDDSNPWASTVVWDNFRGGIGVQFLNPKKPEQSDRAWYATANIRHHGQIVLPALVTTTAQATAADIQLLATFKSEVYAPHGTAVYLYNNTNDTYSNVRTLLNNATDWAVGLLSGVETLVLATGSECDFATNSSTWARNTTDVKYVVFGLKDLLWGMDVAGQLYSTDSLAAAWTTEGVLQLPSGYIKKLLVARGPDREQKLYASTTVGYYVYDMENQRFEPTEFADLPYHPNGGQGSAKFRGNLHYPAGNSIYQFQAGADKTFVDIMGPDLDHGLPSDRRGVIVQLESSHNELLAALDASQGTGVSSITLRSSGGFGSSRMSTFGAGAGYSLVLGWDTRGWRVLWQSGSSARPVNAIMVSNAYSEYRLWIAANQRVYWMDLPVDVINPLQVTTTTYGTGATLETPWIDNGLSHQTKLALQTIVETTNPTSSETVLVEYALNYIETYYTHATISATGEHQYYFGSKRRGTPYRAIKYRLTFARGGTTTNTPILRKLTHVFRPRIDVLYGVDVTLDLTETKFGAPIQQLKQLREVMALPDNMLCEVTWRDDLTDTQNYVMDPVSLTTLEETGRDVNGHVQVRFIEPQQSSSR